LEKTTRNRAAELKSIQVEKSHKLFSARLFR
jgi:hypothetical protein